MEALSLGRLLENIVTGEDRSVQSVKLLGQHKIHDWWKTDRNNGGVIMLVAPPGLAENALDSRASKVESQSLQTVNRLVRMHSCGQSNRSHYRRGVLVLLV